MEPTRRDALVYLATLVGASVVGPRIAAAAVGPMQSPAFSPGEIALLDEIGERIIPETDIPGAKAVGIGEFLAMMITDCYEPSDQQRLKQGLVEITSRYRQRFGSDFVRGSAESRTELLDELDKEQQAYHEDLAQGRPPHFFRELKELTVLGYFSSELGATQAVRYIEVPGRYDGNAPYQRGDRAWFN